MKTKRILALVTAIVFALTVIPTAVFARSDEKAETPGEKFVNTNYININGCILTYSELNSTYPCTYGEQGTRKYVEITNGGHANTTAGFESCTFTMKAGDVLQFEFWYSTELGYDYFDFIACYGGAEYNPEHLSGSTGGDDVWFIHTFTAPQDGDYTFRWEYSKDGSNDYGADCVRVSNLYLTEHWNYQRALVVTKPGTGLFEYNFDEDYPFYAILSTGNEDHPNFLRSSNNGVASSTSQFTIYEHTRPCTLAFDYAVSCEDVGSSGSYFDYFEVTVDGSSVLKIAGNHWGWTHFTYELTQGWHEIVFKYVKDSSVDGNYDEAAVDNIELVYPASEAAARWQDINGIGSTSNKIYLNTPSGTNGWGTKINAGGGNMRAYPNNRYLGASISKFETIVNMLAGERVSFDYVVSSENEYDRLNFRVNGELKLTASGWEDRMWHTYTFTAPSDGSYSMQWMYFKDQDISDGWDYAYIRNLTYTGSINQVLDLDDLIVSEQSDDIHFTTDPTYGHGFTPFMIEDSKDGEPRFAAISRNKYMENTTATLRANGGNLPAGTMIYFDYKVSSETYDKLTFKLMNGSQVVSSVDLGGGDGSWGYYEMTTTTAGNFDLVWEYSKDSTIDQYDDCAMIANVIVEKPMPTLDEVLNADNTQMQLHFVSGGNYPFEVFKTTNGQYEVRSTNAGVASSSSQMSTLVHLTAGDEVSFYYYLESEQNYDFFNFLVNGTRILHESGEPGIQLYRWNAPSTGDYNLMWEYTKDSSQNYGQDCVKIYEVCVRHSGASEADGDVNGDGVVDISDALLAMRYAMGLISLSSAQLEHADVNNDGSVDISDALIIMRVAMGLITL